jgi:hypothetical protein
VAGLEEADNLPIRPPTGGPDASRCCDSDRIKSDWAAARIAIHGEPMEQSGPRENAANIRPRTRACESVNLSATYPYASNLHSI